MIDSHRCALLLRPQLAKDIEASLLKKTIEQFRRDASLIPSGRVRLDRWRVDTEASSDSIGSTDLFDVDALYLDRQAVTNEQFQHFVDHGGYEAESLWNTSVWPAVKEFIDQTGRNGPRFWSQGRYPESKATHPVVGVSWFEAEAYARWVGMRLPTDAEWVRTASAPIDSDGALAQRKYPWGDTFSHEMANLWTSGVGDTVSTLSYAAGDSVSGVRQLIGNVWEWTSTSLQLWNRDVLVPISEPMKSLRGGAFDSYLESRATCQCRSGESPLARRHNIGFRCAVAAHDVAASIALVTDTSTS
ncbi:MAG: SUMF1/EgtB/PvdO family nonheme iron enzyme [Planctomycetaceae bacterium]|nr:SUMF1/EgtB/PvdO family nonheme iron enzyme [Planctomycetales bacterium]MCB9926893.1 SUMF1/EgtB/PvdO family nonheme iron enzyme [Planctomycetaceae bacterium]